MALGRHVVFDPVPPLGIVEGVAGLSGGGAAH